MHLTGTWAAKWIVHLPHMTNIDDSNLVECAPVSDSDVEVGAWVLLELRAERHPGMILTTSPSGVPAKY